MPIVLRSEKGSVLTGGEVDGNFSELDSRTAVAWANLVAVMARSGIANPPGIALYRGVFPVYAFDPDNVEQCSAIFHLPHDFQQGTDFWPHGHVLTDTASSGVVRWGFDISYAQEYDSEDISAGPPSSTQVFSDPVTIYVEQTIAATHENAHIIITTDSAFNIPALAADSVILMRVFRDATHVNDTYPDDIHLLTVDLYYRSQGFGTNSL